MLRRQLVVAKRRTKASKTFGVFETPFPTAPPPVKYSTGDRAGETVPAEVPFRFRDAAPETTTRDGHDAGVHTLLGRTAEHRISEQRQAHLEELIQYEEEKRLAYHTGGIEERRLRHVKVLAYPLLMIGAVGFYMAAAWAYNPQENLKLRKQDRENFEKVAGELQTFKIEATLTRIQQIEAELTKRGVKLPEKSTS
eukprot:TRINITY_DN17290_c0_g1_i4.p1 TRINITY_DN17290_c0_g1~~TRINITY_DN17290_c0_g1_i4.p1  ORF type:complete len:196 (+),score=21.28 TRINITY_DN17290_c0_g1_i4:100-687(+)